MAQSVDWNISSAITYKYANTSALSTALGGGLHRDKVRAPVAGALETQPYAIFTITAGGGEYVLSTDGSVIDWRVVTFDVYGPPDTADAAAAALRTAFHEQQLIDNAGYTALAALEYQDDLMQLITNPRRSGEAVWNASWSMKVCSQL